MLTIGIVEGIAEATAAIIKIFSGVLSDYPGKRKLLVSIGYGMVAFTKPGNSGQVLTSGYYDRGGALDALAVRKSCYVKT